jgi:lysozyme family protein
MAARSYEEAIRRVLAHEGGYANHKSDPGGETMYGITIAVARANGYTGPMRSLPIATAKDIYRRKYWNAVRGDDLPAGVDYAVFDYAVNSGTGRAVKVINAAVGAKSLVDAVAAAAKRDPGKLVEAICNERMRFLQGLSTWRVFGKGWSSRVNSVRSAAVRMAAGQAQPATAALNKADEPIGKGVATPDNKKVAGSGAAGPVVGSAVDQVSTGALTFGRFALYVGLGLLAAGITYLILKRRADKQNDAPLIVAPVPIEGDPPLDRGHAVA